MDVKNCIGKIVGATLFAGATVAIWLWPDPNVQTEPDDSIRPVRSVVVQSGVRAPDLYLTGKIKASEDRTLSFKQPGRIQRLPAVAGQEVKKGEKLAWLDPLDFEKDLAKAEAAESRDRLTYARKLDALKKNAISKEEVSQAEAQHRQSEAQLAIARRALEDTVLYAPFDCTVAEVPANELDVVTAGRPIVLVKDLSKVKIDVVCPETLVISARKIEVVGAEKASNLAATVSFDSVPGRSFPVKFVEYVANADTRTQTYIATYIMDAPKDLLLLPGMSATMFISGDSYRYESDKLDKAISVPESAIGVADDGSHFVWVLMPDQASGIYVAKRRVVRISSRQGGVVTVVEGLSAGERVSTAGVSVLTEGRKVRLLTK